jgi:hypothetical protein
MTILGIMTNFIRKKASRAACCLLRSGFLLGLFFNPKDGDMFLQYID